MDFLKIKLAYYELMRCKPHDPGKGNVAAPDFVRAGCEAAFPWQIMALRTVISLSLMTIVKPTSPCRWLSTMSFRKK